MGDFNGDGYADLAVGAPYYDAGQTSEGAVFIYAGSPTGPAASPTWTLQSNQPGALFGTALAAGDTDFDGNDDLLVGAPGYSNGEAAEGAAFLFLGTPSGLATSASWTVESDQAYARLGSALALGDVTGDQRADALVGAFAYSNGEPEEGALWLWSSFGQAANTPATANWSIYADLPQAHLGASLAVLGDVNGDGIQDFAAGLPRFSNPEIEEGAVWVFWGSDGALSANADWTAQSNLVGARLGHAVNAAGDVNRDGYADVIAGAPSYSTGALLRGAAYAWMGGASGLGPAGRPGNADWSAQGAASGDRLGWHVGRAGDHDGDGFQDIVVTRPFDDAAGDDAGAVLVFGGSSAGLATSPHATLSPASTGHAGIAVTVGDVNGDNAADLVSSAPFAGAGQAVVFANLSNSAPTARLTTTIQLAGAASGGSLRTDLNTAGLLPLAQPYGSSPWQYAGAEEVGSIPSAQIVDWVLLGLRASPKAPDLTRRAGFLLEDGSVVDLDGSSPVSFQGFNPTTYYLVIYHRNHLALVSDAALTLTASGTATFSFSSAPCTVNTAPALCPGDIDQDGHISALDALEWQRSSPVSATYAGADLNLDGSIDTTDLLMIWLVQNGR